jgi:sugar-specific transcriptional regulator TrmB
MKRLVLAFIIGILLVSCSSSFQSFYNNHKADMGATSFQVPNFMKAVLNNISPEVKHAIGNISDFKYIKFENVDALKRQNLILEMSTVTNNGFTDVFRKNEAEHTRIISVREIGPVVTDAIIFNSSPTETTAYYLQGNFDPEKIKKFSDEESFNTFSSQLMQSYNTNLNPSFNPEN